MIKSIHTLTQVIVLVVLGFFVSNTVEAQCSGLTMQVAKDSIGAGNVKYTYYVDKDSACLPFKLKIKMSGYPSGMIFKYYIGSAAGITSSNDTFSTILTNSGYYNVKVELINGAGSIVCTINRDSMVRAGVGKSPNISISPPILCNGPDSVTFIDSTPGIVSRIWIIDGVTYSNNSKVVKHKFSSSGFKSFEILLTSQGDSCQLYKKYDSAVAIYSASTVDFSASSTSGCKPFVPTFTPNITLNGNTVSSYDWTFTGGSPSTYSGQNPGSVTYSNSGSYDVKLDIVTTVGCSYSLQKNGYINVGQTYTPSITIDDSTLCNKQYAKFTPDKTGLPSSGAMTWTVYTGTVGGGAAGGVNKYAYGNNNMDSFRVNFDKINNYVVRAEYSYNGCKTTQDIPLRMTGPLVGFSSNFKQQCGIPATFKIKNDTKNNSGANNYFTWLISDSAGKYNAALSQKSNADTLVVTITKFGSFGIKLYDSSSTGCTDSITSANFLTVKAPKAAMRVRDSSGATSSTKRFCTCEKVVWKNNSGFYTTDSIWVWFTLYDKMDTTVILKEDTINATRKFFTTDTIVYRYCDTGMYIGRMITWSDGGCIDTTFDTITIAPPVAAFSIDKKKVCVGESVTLTEMTTPVIATLKHQFYYKHRDSTTWIPASPGGTASITLTDPGLWSFAYVAGSGGACRDSIVKIDSVAVGQLSIDFKSATAYGCKGSTIKFDTMSVVNIRNGSPSALKYDWAVNPTTNVTIASPKAKSTNITFGDNGTYDITLTMTDTLSGCTQSVSKFAMISIGLTAGFSIPGTACYKSTISVTNTSQNFPNNYTWSASPSSGSKKVVFDSSAANGFSASTPGITFPDSGCYRITMRAWKGSCWDTISQVICIERVVPKFSVVTLSDTLQACAPQFVKFVSSSINASYHYWSFGDGNSKYVYTDSTSNLYRTNDSCFDVSLIAISGNGCQDTLTKYCYIHFIGPVPKYLVNKSIGCEPLQVCFTDQSYNIVNKVFDYGDGATTNGTISCHTYYSSSPGSTYDTYVTKLTAYSNNCPNPSIYPDPTAGHTVDTIKVFKKAQAYFYADTLDACEPFCVQFHDTSKYVQSWYWDFGDGVKDTATDTLQNPVHCYKPGTYTVKLYVNNQAGCSDTATRTNYITVRARCVSAFSVNDSVKCTGITSTFTDKSTNATLRWWYYNDTLFSTNANPTRSFAPGKYTIKLVSNNPFGCADSTVKDTLIRVWDKSAPKIYSNLTVGCEPFTTQLFGDSSLFADDFYWVVFNGTGIVDTSRQTNPSFSLPPGTYSVKLYTNNVNSCLDSITKLNYLTVYNRAKPAFVTNDTLGCDTIYSAFTNNSQYATRYRWDFGDNTVDTINANPSHGYGVGTYSIKLWANNANNCSDSVTQSSRVLVVNKPKPKIYSNYVVGCEPFCTDLFADSTLYATGYSWIFGNGDTSDVMNPNECYTPGVYSPKVVARNNYGCSDSVTMTNFITVYQKPTADFNSDFQWLCFKQPVTYTDLSISNVAISRWAWDFGDFTYDTSSAPPAKVYNNPGLKTVTLMIENSNGCRDTLVRTDYVFMDDSIPPAVTQIQYVTYNNGNIDIFWEQNTDTTFYQNKLYRDDPNNQVPPGVNVFSSNLVSDVFYQETSPAVDPNTLVYSYKMTTSDSCGWVSPLSTEHRNMLLTANTLSAMTNIVTWTPYVGWGTELKEYQIFKSAQPTGQNLPTFAYFRTVPPSDTSMIDSLLCDSDYYYQIYAIHKTQAWQSLSNPVFNHPTFISPDTLVSILRATVIDDQNTHITWTPSNHGAIKNYVIDKYDIVKGWQNYYALTKGNVNYFLDVNDVQVHTTSYAYRVSVEDYCGNLSPVSTDIGKTILLDASIESDFVVLRWSPYQYWANGVKQYEIQINYGVNDWRPVVTLSGSDTSYTDNNVYEDLYTNYCYRVIALENDVLPDTSMSNIDCAVVPSRIWMPNAFSPNGKGPGANEIFKPSSLSIYTKQQNNEINDYVFKVYNRWGELVFETHEVAQGWDGTFKGKPCQTDVYAFTVRARGRDGFPYELNGNVHLLR